MEAEPLGQPCDLLADDHVAGLRDRGKSRGDLTVRPYTSPSWKITGPAWMPMWAGGSPAGRRSLFDHIQTGVHGTGRLSEVEHPSVAQPTGGQS